MRRLAALTVLLAVAGAAAALLFGSSAQGSSSARFDVIFDDARGLIGGQLVKIAGATAGRIENVVVTPDFKARIEATVESRFMPFHQNAACTIRPEGLIAENYVDCDPGTADSPPLQASHGHPPTVPVTNTTEPVSLLDLFNIFNLPTRQRFAMIVDELGIGTSSRGEDFNDILRRANPALALARQVISILSRQRAQLATLVDATNTIASQGATHTANLQSFLDRAASLTSLTASHQDSLSQAIHRLPGLLGAAQPALAKLDTVAVDGTPLLAQIHAAVPALNRVSTDLGPFVAVAKPALAKLSTTLGRAIPAIRDTTPVVAQLEDYANRSKSGTALVARLNENLQQHGFVENFLSVAYYVGASLARFDRTSHLLPLLLLGPHNGACGNYATKPVSGCSAHYGRQPQYQPSSTAAPAAAGSLSGAAAAGSSTSPAASSASLPGSGTGSLPPGRARQLVRRLVSKILHSSGHLDSATLAQLRSLLGTGTQSQDPATLRSLIAYLLR